MLSFKDLKKVFIIAEAGVNHNGDIAIAKKMIDLAGEAGVNAIKFQAFKTDNFVMRDAQKAVYQKLITDPEESQYEMLKKLELNDNELRYLAGYTRKKKIIFLSSSFDKESVDLLDEIGVPVFKVASGEITHLPLIRYIAKKGKPIILSTGMANLREIRGALNVIKKEGVRDIVLLHCISDYPTKMKEVNLKAMSTLREVFKLPVGFSDHTLGMTAAISAVALGACLIEKHFTLNKAYTGPDHKVSLGPNELKEMVYAIRDVEKAFGSGIKKPTQNEERIKKLVRRSIFAEVNIPKGTKIENFMLGVKRPNVGLEPKYLSKAIGSIAKKFIKKDTPINLKDLL